MCLEHNIFPDLGVRIDILRSLRRIYLHDTEETQLLGVWSWGQAFEY